MESKADPLGTGRDAAWPARARQLLVDVSTWRLPQAAWSRPAAAVEALAAAYDSGDAVALRIAVAKLEVLSPNRVERIADPADVPPPEPLAERVAALVHIIPVPEEDGAGKAGGDDRR
ncbi:CATRA system-associated protein [Streptomyces cyaneofuscatus]|uniref:CATRA system-associated protein n=1 Tax=Streptomyces cyaneofuscatus TaxID=66883 RepID=UPI0033BB436B